MSDAPKDYIAEQLHHIVAIEIQINEIIGKFKMSQNRDHIDAIGIVENLEEQENIALAKAVQDYIKD